jgi:hypothetical protein
MKKILFLICSFAVVCANGQVYPQFGARSNGLGGTALNLNDVWSVYNNPGAFGAIDKTELGFNYENRYLLKELSQQSLAFGYHTKKNGNFGLHLQQYGFSLYREMIGGVTYGAQLFNNFYGGLSVNFHSIQLGGNYGARNTASGALGLYYKLNRELSFGVRILNISRVKLADYQDERLPTAFALGTMYQFSEMLSWSLEAEKSILQPINVKTGLEIHPHDILYLRLGVNSYPFQSSFGFGVLLDKFQIDMATTWHSVLGISPSAGLKYSFN